jgi:PadR family transcriptional regulator, regulatory protein PadR
MSKSSIERDRSISNGRRRENALTQEPPPRVQNQELYIGLVRLHVLHHASEGAIFGLGIIQELGRHGYRLGPGTIYPLLHGMEGRGWLRAQQQLVEGRKRKTYIATASGRRALRVAREQVRQLYEEMCEEHCG